jgi:hypothetical protein
MTASELADELERLYQQDIIDGVADLSMPEAATMLRHQADRIRNLEKSLGFKNSGYETINLTPQLELTDEEIRHIQAICHLKDVGYDGFIMRFARAILRKAQDK